MRSIPISEVRGIPTVSQEGFCNHRAAPKTPCFGNEHQYSTQYYNTLRDTRFSWVRMTGHHPTPCRPLCSTNPYYCPIQCWIKNEPCRQECTPSMFKSQNREKFCWHPCQVGCPSLCPVSDGSLSQRNMSHSPFCGSLLALWVANRQAFYSHHP